MNMKLDTGLHPREIGVKCEEHPNRRERRKEETRLKIIGAALSLLSEKPFDQITVEEITERADVAKGTFFAHFPNKELVLCAHVENLIDEVSEYVEALNHEECGSQWDTMMDIMGYVAQQDAKTPTFVRTHLAVCCLNADVRERLRQLGVEAIHRCAQGIEIGQKIGEFRNDVSAEELANYFMLIYRMSILEWAMNDGAQPFAEALKKTMEFFKPAICKQEA